MRKAILTIVTGKHTEAIWAKTESSISAYADRIGADLIVMKESTAGYASPHWMKFAIYEFLRKKYHRILYLDADIIIRPDCPDLFLEVPETHLGVFNEGKFVPRAIALHEVKVRLKTDLAGWNGVDYFNTGVMVVSRAQRHVFKPPKEVPKLNYAFAEQTYLNFCILTAGVKIHELNWKFNRMSLMNKWLGVSRLDCYIVHYAGVYDTELVTRTIEADLEQWAKAAPAYRYEPCIYINLGGGLGDQICAEPAIRYLAQTICPKAEILLLTGYPELFHHLPNVKAFKQIPDIRRPALYEIETHPSPTMQMRKYICHFFAHGVDYNSMAILKRFLPNQAKRIMIDVPQADRESVSEFNADVIIHPGRGWPIKSFPAEWWNKVILELSKVMRVAVVGKNVSAEHGTVDVAIPDGVLDLRDRQSLWEFIAMIETTPVLVTNDSAPVHLAGAFDNYIVVIPTGKHGDHLLPYRYGGQEWKAAAVTGKLLDDDFPRPPMQPEYNINDFNVDVRDYLPTPQEVIGRVLMFHVQQKPKSYRPSDHLICLPV